MKKTWFCLMIAFLMMMMVSCHTNQKFVVYGVPGTVITSMDDHTTLAIIDQSGTAEINLKRDDGYYAFLQAKAPDSDKLIPFALDYRDMNRSETNWTVALWFAMPPWYPLGLLGPWWIFGCQIGTKYDYDYLDHQQTNNDLIR